MPTALPFLMFEGKAEEAMNFYVATFPGAKVEMIQRYGPGGRAKEGTVMMAKFFVAGQTVMCTDSFVHHEFSFTPAFSFFVTCDSEDEIRRMAKVLAEGGSELMPLNNYGFSTLFAWVNDRFGVSWQLNLG
jgi:predicted 3-demethylubiquinone-9 3-methyltransferase (glyoxalase superfamily)